MSKKNLYIILVIISILLLILIISGMIKSKVKQEVKPTPIPAVTFFPYLSITPRITSPSVSGDKVDIKGVTVNNFYKSAISSDEMGNYLIYDSPKSQIAYLSQFEFFQISVNTSPFLTEREDAEKQLLKILGISEQEACRLTVYVSTPEFADPQYSGKRYNLSFCNDD